MICDTFPPQSDVGGLRPAMFSKYLPSFGWRPVIFTRTYSKSDVLYLPSMILEGLPPEQDIISFDWGTSNEKKAIQNRKFYEKFEHFFKPDFAQPPGYTEKMIYEAEKKILTGKYDVIWATSPHIGCLSVAAYLSKKLNIPWVGDFRDIMEQDNIVTFRDRLLRYRLLFRRWKIVQSSSALVTVSNHHAKILHKYVQKKVDVIPNGFDQELFKPVEHHKSEKFTIVYMGRILNLWLRNPEPLFEALDILSLNGDIMLDDFELNFYGTEPQLLKELVARYNCRKIVHALPRVAYQDVPNILGNSCVNLILTNKGRHGILTTKAFEYLAVKRPVLCVLGDGGELERLVNETNAGSVAHSAGDIIEVFKKWYFEWKTTSTINSRSSRIEIEKYSRKRQAGQLAEILNRCVSL